MKKAIIVLLIFAYFIPFLVFKNEGVRGVVIDSWVDEYMIVSNLVYMENRQTMLLVGKTLELGEHYYFEHPDVSLKDLMLDNKVETMQLVLQSSDLEVSLMDYKRKRVRDIKANIITMPVEDDVMTTCDYDKYRLELLEDYYHCNFKEGDSVGHPIMMQKCLDMIEIWKERNPEIIFSLPKEEWYSINSRSYRAEALMENYSSHCDREMIPLKGAEFMMFDMLQPEETDWSTGFKIYYFVK